MTDVLQILLLTSMAGLAMPAGAALARIEHIRPRWLENELRHSVIAFGGGVLLSAVALVLVPEGAAKLSLAWTGASFLAGGMAFMALDRALASLRSSASQLIAMLADFIPEAIALGAASARGDDTGVLLALLITLQNVPEAFNAFRELRAAGLGARIVIVSMLCLAPLGPACGLAGYYTLAESPRIVAGIMLFAAGGILYLTFQDIAPQAKLANRRAPAIGAVAGFLCGLLGHMALM